MEGQLSNGSYLSGEQSIGLEIHMTGHYFLTVFVKYPVLGGYISSSNWQAAHPSHRSLIVIIAGLLLFSSININKFLQPSPPHLQRGRVHL